jgi:hypothetical protein
MGPKFYIPAAVAISGNVDLKSIKKIISQATNEKVNEQKIQEISDKVLATLENSGEKFDLKQMFGSINNKIVPVTDDPVIDDPANANATANDPATASANTPANAPVPAPPPVPQTSR